MNPYPDAMTLNDLIEIARDLEEKLKELNRMGELFSTKLESRFEQKQVIAQSADL